MATRGSSLGHSDWVIAKRSDRDGEWSRPNQMAATVCGSG